MLANQRREASRGQVERVERVGRGVAAKVLSESIEPSGINN